MNNKSIYLNTEKNKIAKINYPLVKKFVRNKKDIIDNLSEQDKDDLLSEINYRYCFSIHSFDKEKGFALSTYVWHSMEMATSDFIKNKSKNDNQDVFNLHFLNKKSSKRVESERLFDLIDNIDLVDIEKCVIKEYFNNNITLEDIGIKVNLSKERVRQIKEGALKKIKKYVLKNNVLIDDFVIDN